VVGSGRASFLVWILWQCGEGALLLGKHETSLASEVAKSTQSVISVSALVLIFGEETVARGKAGGEKFWRDGDVSLINAQEFIVVGHFIE
jgi:hypothetical protein